MSGKSSFTTFFFCCLTLGDMLWCEAVGSVSKTKFASIGYHRYGNGLGLYLQLTIPKEACLLRPSSNATANWSASFGLHLCSVHNRSHATLLCIFRIKTSYTELLVCPSNSLFVARTLSGFQTCWRFSLYYCSRKKKRIYPEFYSVSRRGLPTLIQKNDKGIRGNLSR